MKGTFFSKLITPLLFIFSYLSVTSLLAIPTNLVYQGQLLDASNNAVENANVQFLVEVYDTAGTCLLFEEVHSAVDMTGSGGVFSLILGAGAAGGSDPGNGIFDAYDNGAATLNCGGGGTVTTADGEDRQVKISFDPAGATSYVAFNNQKVESVPYAFYAKNLGGAATDDGNGNLDVTGAVGIGTPASIPTCDAAHAGWIYWDNSASKYLACDGTAWVDAATLMGASSGGGGGFGNGTVQTFTGGGGATLAYCAVGSSEMVSRGKLSFEVPNGFDFAAFAAANGNPFYMELTFFYEIRLDDNTLYAAKITQPSELFRIPSSGTTTQVSNIEVEFKFIGTDGSIRFINDKSSIDPILSSNGGDKPFNAGAAVYNKTLGGTNYSSNVFSVSNNTHQHCFGIRFAGPSTAIGFAPTTLFTNSAYELLMSDSPNALGL